jgi:hypothetical protein
MVAPRGVKMGEDPLHDDGLGGQLVFVADMPLSRPPAGQRHQLGQLEEAVELLGGPLQISDIRHEATIAGSPPSRANSRLITWTLSLDPPANSGSPFPA